MATALALLCFPALFAQQTSATALTLQQCVNRAVEKNINVTKAVLDKDNTRHQADEARASLYPKIDIQGTFQDNTKLAMTILPGEIMGEPGTYIPLAMGTKFNTSANISANQVLYNQTAMTALKLSKKAEYAATLGVEKAKEEITKEVAKLYFLVQTTAEQNKLVEENITRTQRMTDIVKKQVDNGIAKRVDYDRIVVSLQNLQTQLDNNRALYEQQLNMMKYTLEMPISQPIALTDSVDMVLLKSLPGMEIGFNNHTDIQLLEAQKDVASLYRKVVAAEYYPSLSLFGQYGYQGMRDQFKDYFRSGPMNKWFDSSYIGIQLNIPIFDGFQRRSKARRAKNDYLTASLTLDNTKERFSADYKNALNNYLNNKLTVERQQNNIELAQKVYQETALKYREGLSTMSDLLQDEMGLNNAQSGYLNALYKLKEAELDILSLNGEIKEIMN